MEICQGKVNKNPYSDSKENIANKMPFAKLLGCHFRDTIGSTVDMLQTTVEQAIKLANKGQDDFLEGKTTRGKSSSVAGKSRKNGKNLKTNLPQFLTLDETRSFHCYRLQTYNCLDPPKSIIFCDQS